MRRSLIIGILMLLSFTLSQAQEASTAVVGVRDNDLILVNGDEEIVIAEARDNYWYYPLDANDNGDLLYMARSLQFPDLPDELYVYDGESRLITSDFIGDCPPNFIDNEHITYVSSEVLEEITTRRGVRDYIDFVMPIVSYNWRDDEIIQLETVEIPDINLRWTIDPYDFFGFVVAQEQSIARIFSANTERMVIGNGPCWNSNGNDLNIIDDNLIGIPDRLINPTVTFSSDLTQAVVMHEKGLGNNLLSIYDLESGDSFINEVEDNIEEGYRQFYGLHWGQNDLIYFSSSRMVDSFEQVSNDAMYTIFSSFRQYHRIPFAESSIFQYEPETDTLSLWHFAPNTFGIRRIEVQGNHIYWSETPDVMSAILSAENSGFDESLSDDEIIQLYLLPDVYRMSLEGGEPELVAENLQRFITISMP
ncbi:MAG: hypothetical protein AAF846_02675 [Chloroflexota bacterium]